MLHLYLLNLAPRLFMFVYVLTVLCVTLNHKSLTIMMKLAATSSSIFSPARAQIGHSVRNITYFSPRVFAQAGESRAGGLEVATR